MKLRKIYIDRLVLGAILYRLHIIIIQSLFFYAFYGFTTGVWEWKWAVGTSIMWNIINTGLYLNYHYWFARICKLGRE